MNTLNAKVVVPKWVKFIAQDKNGRWFGYINEPTPITRQWAMSGVNDGLLFLYQGIPPKNFKNELYEWVWV